MELSLTHWPFLPELSHCEPTLGRLKGHVPFPSGPFRTAKKISSTGIWKKKVLNHGPKECKFPLQKQHFMLVVGFEVTHKVKVT